MSKLEIEFPEKVYFSTEIPIRKIDLALDIHVSFASILDLVNEAQTLFFNSYSLTPLDVFGKGVIFANAQVIYQGELVFGDVVLIDVSLSGFFEKGFDFYFKLSKKNKNIPVALVKIRVLFFDYSTKKVGTIPKEFLDILGVNLIPKQDQGKTDETININSLENFHPVIMKLYEITKSFPREEINNLTIKIRRNAVGIGERIVLIQNMKDKVSLMKSSKSIDMLFLQLVYYLQLAKSLKYSETDGFISELKSWKNEFKNYLKSKLEENL